MATDLETALENAVGTAQDREGMSIRSFAASLATAVIVFVVELLLFVFLKGKFTRIYQPRTYLVPDRERIAPSPPGLFSWIGPVFRTSNSEFLRKCGLDAYFFLRYLRMLIKIFVPLGCVILPVLLPLNKVDGKGTSFKDGVKANGQWNVSGLDQLAWGNIKPVDTTRYWGHLVMALVVIIYVCAVFFDELKGYIRVRQAYMTSPQHRLRASATTVLVTGIPQGWLSVEALDSLYDVFPGGIRNIWINRNLDDLSEKVKLRDAIALKLEEAETGLIVKCKKAGLKQAKKMKNMEVASGKNKQEADGKPSDPAMGSGISSGNPHQAGTLDEILHRRRNPDSSEMRQWGKLDPAREATRIVGQSVGKLGKSVLGTGRKAASELEVTTTQMLGLGGGDTVTDGAHSDGAYVAASQYDSLPDVSRTETRLGSKISSWKLHFPSSNSGETGLEPDEYPLAVHSDQQYAGGYTSQNKEQQDQMKLERVGTEKYPIAYNTSLDSEDFGQPLWKKYIKEKDRETMRLPLFGFSWMPSLWLIGKKVDTIDYCRKELARLNLEIELDQQQPEKFPLMNSAFVQFNHQVAAHMACQSVSHHVPKQMAPRTVEISPDDVIWDNLSIGWSGRYLRTFGVLTLVCGMVFGWAFPVAFTGLLSQLSYLEGVIPSLGWLRQLPGWIISAIQGILPPLFLAILMALLPLMLRFLCRAQGLHTGMEIELTVQNYYFAFLFVQIFLVVAISSSFSAIIDNITDVMSWPEMLAQNIPVSSNYFFSYMILQAMSVSAGALVQILGLVSWFVLAPILDNTARKKWGRTTNLNQVQWGTFFPMYTTLAAIGLIYSVIAPLILVFNVITFSLFWFVYRYNTLYVTRFRLDTGGLLFPRGIYQLFTGLYTMEISLIGLFFLARDEKGKVACKGQGICMIVFLFLTIIYHFLLNDAFGPLIRYLPITLEDDAVRRDEEFNRAQRVRLGLSEDEPDEADPGGEDRSASIELENLSPNGQLHKFQQSSYPNPVRSSWAARSPQRSKFFRGNAEKAIPNMQQLRKKMARDAEAQEASGQTQRQSLFAGIHDELEDLTPDERDHVQRAFQHDALRARRPVIWIPRDDLGVSDDEVYRTQQFSKHIWISNEYQALDGKARTIFCRSPPDFSDVDLIQL